MLFVNVKMVRPDTHVVYSEIKTNIGTTKLYKISQESKHNPNKHTPNIYI